MTEKPPKAKPEPTGPRCLVTIADLHPGEKISRPIGRGEVKEYPTVGGRLRAFRTDWGAQGSIETGIDPALSTKDLTVYRAIIRGGDRVLATATGTCNARDFQGRETRLEMAETRAIGRALRFAGYGVDGSSAEEMEGADMHDDERPPQSPASQPLQEARATGREGHGTPIVPVAFRPREALTPQQRKALETRGFAENPAEPGTYLARMSPAQATKERDQLAAFGDVRLGDQEAA